MIKSLKDIFRGLRVSKAPRFQHLQVEVTTRCDLPGCLMCPGGLGRDAKDLAKAWCCRGSVPSVPVELKVLLSTHPDTDGAIVLEAIPESRIAFDDIPGESRNTDLVCIR